MSTPAASPASPEAALAALAGCSSPFLIGVRHHSPALAVAMPALLEAARPDRIFVELPADLQPWLAWLAHGDLAAPVALAAVAADGEQLGFWPFADFSPELAALRWAATAGVPIEAFDLPLATRPPAAPRLPVDAGEGAGDRLMAATSARDFVDLWDVAVEAAAPGAPAEAVRRAALALGWTLRVDAAGSTNAGIDPVDLARETYMRERIDATAASRVAVVVGAFHAPALLPDPLLWTATSPGTDSEGTGRDATTSLIPYAFELLDARSGYPAGVRDPAWQQRVWAAAGDPEAVTAAAAQATVSLCAELRRDGHVAGVPDAREALRMAIDLSRLRGLPAPSRRELLEALTSCLGQGEPLGRGRALARVAPRVLIGDQAGTLAPGTPRSGLAPHVETVLAELALPGPGDTAAELRLDPLRSRLDRRRHITLARLRTSHVPYGAEYDVEGVGGVDALTRRWSVQWRPPTTAGVELAGTRGATLKQAAEGTLRLTQARLEANDAFTSEALLGLVAQAAECGLARLTGEYLARLVGDFLTEADLGELLSAHALAQRIQRGQVPGISVGAVAPTDPADPQPLPQAAPVDLGILLDAAVRAVAGLAGATEPSAAAQLLALVNILRSGDGTVGSGQLLWVLRGFARGDASPLIQGAATGALLLLGVVDSLAVATEVGSWLDTGPTPASGADLAARLQGILAMAGPLLEAAPDVLDDLTDRVTAMADDDFLTRLPSLRHGFEVLSPGGRTRFLDAVADRLRIDAGDLSRAATLDVDPAVLALGAIADAAGRRAVLALDPSLLAEHHPPAPPQPPEQARDRRAGDASSSPVREGGGAAAANHAIPPLDRWRLILGRQRERLPAGFARHGAALDELYGAGHGEGSRGDLPGTGREGGRGEAFPTAREWADELEDIFGTAVRDEVLARAAAHGRTDVLDTIDPDAITPSVDLLESVLQLKGALPEAQLARLRQLVQRVTDAVTRELARQIRPALTGLTTPRPTRRPGGPVDLGRTIAANLHRARPQPDGTVTIVPEHLRFKTRGRRHADWHIALVVDVSGSMETSVIYSALVAAVLSGVPALSIGFYAFSTEVVDFTGRVDDPLGLLLEVSVGGGTNIGLGLHYAREQMVVPSRTIVALVTDFEEGVSVASLLAEVRALAESGAHGLGLAALDERGVPEYNRAIAEQVAAAGMPVVALTPLELARWIGEKVRG